MLDPLDLDAKRCCLCHELIEAGYDVTDDDGNLYCEDCWQP